MAGEGPAGFAAKFRAGITKAMTIGLAPDEAERPTFGWDPDRTFVPSDSAGHPWRPGETPDATVAAPLEVQVPCGVQVMGITDEGDSTSVGILNADEVVLTLLDDAWEEVHVTDPDGTVRAFDWVRISGRVFHRAKVVPTGGLFEVGVHRVLVTAVG
jgi:hypothetical protein